MDRLMSMHSKLSAHTRHTTLMLQVVLRLVGLAAKNAGGVRAVTLTTKLAVYWNRQDCHAITCTGCICQLQLIQVRAVQLSMLGHCSISHA